MNNFFFICSQSQIVLDVSCNMGILSMFSAIAGAKHVYAIDTSNIVQLTRRVVADNDLSHKITVIKGSVDEITLPVAKVDVIVSTFFGCEFQRFHKNVQLINHFYFVLFRFINATIDNHCSVRID